jgi:hypothetical protein
MVRREDDRKADEQVGIVRFEQAVTTTIGAGAGDRVTAVRWMMEGEGANGDSEYFEFCNGLPYGYTKKTA